jgi:streptogramin lyase
VRGCEGDQVDREKRVTAPANWSVVPETSRHPAGLLSSPGLAADTLITGTSLRRWLVAALLGVSLLALVLIGPTASSGPVAEADREASMGLARSYGELPLAFERNQGQTDRRVDFQVRAPGQNAFLTSTGATLALDPAGKRASAAAVRLELAGADPASRPTGLQRLPGEVNVIRGNDPSKWTTGAATFARVRYANAYPGIDVAWYGTQGGLLEYDFIVGPGADPGRIALEIEGARRLSLSEGGGLRIETAAGTLVQRPPVAYQEAAGQRQPIGARYELSGGRVNLALSDYDRARPLVIDPVLEYSTLIGNVGGGEGVSDLAIDGAGSAYLVGATQGSDFPTTPGAYDETDNGPAFDLDVFVAKLNPAGSGLVYSTYLGGSDFDDGRSIAIDASGQAHVTGSTGSGDFPTTAGALDTSPNGDSDAFVTTLDSSGGSLGYSTLFGGSAFDGASGIALDSAGNAYVSGQTGSTDLPATPGAYSTSFTPGGFADAFALKLDASGSTAEYATYLGGSDSDNSTSIAVDAAGSAHLVGSTFAADFPTTAGAFDETHNGFTDGFVAELSPDGSALDNSTYLGGNAGDETVSDIALGSGGEAYVSGWTGNNNGDFPTTPGAYDEVGQSNDVFVAQFDPTGSNLVYSTYFAGNTEDTADGIAVDADGSAYITGYSESSDLPITPDAFDPIFDGGRGDAFVAKLTPAGSALVYSTWLGDTEGDFGQGVAVDPASESIFVAGATQSAGFPTTPGAHDVTFDGQSDAFVAKFHPADDNPPETTIEAGPEGPVADSTPTWTLSASEPGSRLECRIDSAPFWDSCYGPPYAPEGEHTPLYALTDGPHTFEVRAVDASGNTDPTPASRSITVDDVISEYRVSCCDPNSFMAITAGPDGALWFTGPFSPNTILRSTTSGVVTEFPLPNSNNQAQDITVGPDGALWFTEFGRLGAESGIGRIETDGDVTMYPLSASATPRGITSGPDGALWFTEVSGNRIMRITTGGAMTAYPLPTPSSVPWEITAGPDGALWFTELGANRIGRITTGGAITEFQLTHDSRPSGITSGPDGALWFTEFHGREGPDVGNRIGRITTSGSVTEFPLASERSGPRDIVTGPDGALWFTEQGDGEGGVPEEYGNRVGRITTDGVITEVRVGFPQHKRSPWGITAGPDGAVWFTEHTFPGIGRIEAPAPPGPVNSASEEAPADGTISTNETTTSADPVGTSVTTPNAGTVTIEEVSTTTPDPVGYTLLDQQVDITAPDASAADPLVLTFRLDASILPPDVDETNIEVFRNGVLVAGCDSGAGSSATPDPCVAGRTATANGIELVIRTSQASNWNFGVASGDNDPPETTIDSGPSGATNDATPTFGFSSDEPGSTFECRFDSAAFAPCSGPGNTHTRATPLSQGQHTFEVRATDPADNTDETPASRSFTVDTQPPNTVIFFGPSGKTNDPSPSFAFLSTESGSTFQCRIDAGPFVPCSGPGPTHTTSSLADGQHTFRVRAVDAAGNVDGSPASRSFTVDTDPPQTTITEGPSGNTKDRTPTFRFRSDEPSGGSFQCSLDGGSFSSCSSPKTYSTLSFGTHTFRVRARDAADNLDPTPASRTFTVRR